MVVKPRSKLHAYPHRHLQSSGTLATRTRRLSLTALFPLPSSLFPIPQSLIPNPQSLFPLLPSPLFPTPPLPSNSLRDWLVALAILLGVFTFLALSRHIARRRMANRQAPRGTTAGFHHLSANLVRQTRFFFFVSLGLWAASLELTLPAHVEDAVKALAIVAVLLQIAIWGNSLITAGLHQYVARRTASGADGDVGIAASQTTIAALGVVARVALWLLLLIVALDSLGVHVTGLIAGLGVTGIALALAVQNILGDLFAAASIVMDKPFVVGDAIGVDTMGGTVERIGLKTTRVRAQTGEQIVFSNADLLKSRIRNFRRTRERTVTLALNIELATPVDSAAHAPDLIREIIRGVPGVRLDRCHVTTPTAAGIGVETVYVVGSSDYGAYMDAQQAITIGILRNFRQAGLALAIPGLTVVTTPLSSAPRTAPGTPLDAALEAATGQSGAGTAERSHAS